MFLSEEEISSRSNRTCCEQCDAYKDEPNFHWNQMVNLIFLKSGMVKLLETLHTVSNLFQIKKIWKNYSSHLICRVFFLYWMHYFSLPKNLYGPLDHTDRLTLQQIFNIQWGFTVYILLVNTWLDLEVSKNYLNECRDAMLIILHHVIVSIRCE